MLYYLKLSSPGALTNGAGNSYYFITFGCTADYALTLARVHFTFAIKLQNISWRWWDTSSISYYISLAGGNRFTRRTLSLLEESVHLYFCQWPWIIHPCSYAHYLHSLQLHAQYLHSLQLQAPYFNIKTLSNLPQKQTRTAANTKNLSNLPLKQTLTAATSSTLQYQNLIKSLTKSKR